LLANRAACLHQALVVFPAFGLIVGAATNWISLLVIFSPIEPFDIGKFIGCGESDDSNAGRETSKSHQFEKGAKQGGTSSKWILHGLFLQRQREVSAVYSRLIGAEVGTGTVKYMRTRASILPGY